MNYYDCAKDLTALKKQPDMGWLKEVPAHALQQSLRDLDFAYNRFFKKMAMLPRFKSKHDVTQSFRIPVGWRLRENRIQIHKGLLIKFRGTPPVGELKSLTVKIQNGKWYAIIRTEQEVDPVPKTGPAIGIDLGLTDLVITSEGKRYESLRPRKSAQRQIKRASQGLNRCQRGSSRRAKAKQRLMRLHDKVKNRRMNHLHQTTHRITSENQAVIVCESLAVKNMMRLHNLAGSIAEASWGELLRQLEYKQAWRGGKLVRIDRFFPSSKTCSACGHLLDRLPLSVREWTCPKCKEVHDRDVNAAKVILQQYRPEEQVGVESTDGSRRKVVRVTGSLKRRCSPTSPKDL